MAIRTDHLLCYCVMARGADYLTGVLRVYCHELARDLRPHPEDLSKLAGTLQEPVRKTGGLLEAKTNFMWHREGGTSAEATKLFNRLYRLAAKVQEELIDDLVTADERITKSCPSQFATLPASHPDHKKVCVRCRVVLKRAHQRATEAMREAESIAARCRELLQLEIRLHPALAAIF